MRSLVGFMVVGEVGHEDVEEEGEESQPLPMEYFLDALVMVSCRWRDALGESVEAWWRVMP